MSKVSESLTSVHPVGLMRKALKLRRTKIGLVVLLVITGLALVGPFVAPHTQTEFIDMPNSLNIPGALFGTDYLGQDVWSRFLIGGRSILLLSLGATSLGLVAGISLGLVAALFKGKVDELIMRIFDVILSFPQILLALLLVSMFDASPWLTILSVGLSTTPRVGRVIRGAALSVVERDFVHAATALGESRFRILFFEVLPNVTGPLLVEANLRFTYSIATIASLAFLGFAPDPTAANWGTMIQENSAVIVVQPWGAMLPVIAIALLTIGTGLFGDGLSRVSAGIDRVGKGD
ncbi:dipeptide transport system permease protein DppC [Acidimicrobiaceae bacterium]|nr:dipeptide transport system permease protein DppC [Acidimicrobiaceae bacterium]